MPKQLLFVLICLFPSFLWSQEDFSLQELSEENGIQVLQISPDDSQFRKGKYHLIDYLYVLIDSTDTLSFLECSSPEYVDSFIPFSSVSGKDLALHQHTYWLRLSVQSTLPEEVSWLTNFVEAEVTTFIPTEKGEVSKNRCGTLIPVEDRYFNNRYGMVAVLPIHIPANNSQTYYWQIKPQLINGAKWYDLNLNFTLLSDSYLTHFLIFEGILLALILGFFFAVRNEEAI